MIIATIRAAHSPSSAQFYKNSAKFNTAIIEQNSIILSNRNSKFLLKKVKKYRDPIMVVPFFLISLESVISKET